jgi:hypothetical protein
MTLSNNWLDKEYPCDCCGDTTRIGNMITDADGDNVCEDCFDVIEIASKDEQETK